MEISIRRLQQFSAEAGDASAHLLALKAFRSLLSQLKKASHDLRSNAKLRSAPCCHRLPYRRLPAVPSSCNIPAA